MSASAPWWRASAGPLPAGSTAGWRRISISMPPTMRRRPRSRLGCASGPRCRRSCRAPAPRCSSAARRWKSSGFADHATYRDHWPLLESSGNAWDRLRAGDAGFVSEQLARRLNLETRRSHRIARAGRQLDARGGRDLRRLRQSQGPGRRQYRSAAPALSRHSANPDGPAGRAGRRFPALIAALQTKFGLDGRNLHRSGRR